MDNVTTGGLPIHYQKLAHGLSNRGHQVTVLYADRFGSKAEPFKDECLNFIPLKFPFPKILHTPVLSRVLRIAGLSEKVRFKEDSKIISRKLRILQEDRSFDIIESPNNGACLDRYHLRMSKSCIRIATTDKEHSEINATPLNPYLKNLFEAEGRTFRKCPNLVTHTFAHRDNICREYNLPAEKFTIIPLSVRIPSEDELSPERNDNRKKVLFVGRFEERKGIDIVLSMIPRVLAKEPDVEFRLVGSDPDNTYEKKFISQNPQLSDKVFFLGEKRGQELEYEYKNCTLFIAPSRYESFGLIYAEAMSFAKPAIGTRIGGIPEVIEDQVSGLLCKNESTDEFCFAVHRLLRDEDLRNKIGAAARKRAMKYFDFDNLVIETEKYYTQIAGRG